MHIFLIGIFSDEYRYRNLLCQQDATQAETLDQAYNKSTIVEIDGTKIGIIGYVTTETVDISHPGPNVQFLDEIERSAYERMKLNVGWVYFHAFS